MCMFDDSDPWDLFASHARTANKEHVCGECGRKVAAGEPYERATGLLDGNWLTYKTCGQCKAAREWLTVICGGYLFNGVEEDLREHLEEEPPISTPELTTLCTWMRTRWQDSTGNLRTVETVRTLVRQSLAPWREWGRANRRVSA